MEEIGNFRTLANEWDEGNKEKKNGAENGIGNGNNGNSSGNQNGNNSAAASVAEATNDSSSSNNESSSQGQTGQPSTNGTGLSLFSAFTSFVGSFFGGPSQAANLPTQASRLAAQNNLGSGLDPESVKETSELDTEANKRVANAARTAVGRLLQPATPAQQEHFAANAMNSNNARTNEARKAREAAEANAKAQANLQDHLREVAQRQQAQNQKRAQEAEHELQMKLASAPLSKKVTENTKANDPVWNEYGLTKEQWLILQEAQQRLAKAPENLMRADHTLPLGLYPVQTAEQQFLQQYAPLFNPTFEAASDKGFRNVTGASRLAYQQQAMEDLKQLPGIKKLGKEFANRAMGKLPYGEAGGRRLKRKTRKHRKAHKKHSSRK